MRFADPFWLVFLVVAGLPWLAQRRRVRVSWPTLDGFAAPEARTWAARLALRPGAGPGGGDRVHGGRAGAAADGGRADPDLGAGGGDRPGGRPEFEHEDGRLPGARGEGDRRLDAAKLTLGRFLEARADDLIGVVGFAGLPDTLAPPTLDRRLTWAAIRAIRPAGAGDDGTDIGGAIAWGLGMLRPIATPRKVSILLTDGRHAPGATGRSTRSSPPRSPGGSA